MNKPYTYYATIRSNYDGDTFRADVRVGFGIAATGNRGEGQAFRVFGCNAIELALPGGREAQANLAKLLAPGTVVVLDSIANYKYGGEFMANVTLPDGRNLTDALIASGYAVKWNGKGLRPVPAWPIPTPTS